MCLVLIYHIAKQSKTNKSSDYNMQYHHMEWSWVVDTRFRQIPNLREGLQREGATVSECVFVQTIVFFLCFCGIFCFSCLFHHANMLFVMRLFMQCKYLVCWGAVWNHAFLLVERPDQPRGWHTENKWGAKNKAGFLAALFGALCVCDINLSS